MFLLQWTSKCRLLLDYVFPTSKMWKKLEKDKGDRQKIIIYGTCSQRILYHTLEATNSSTFIIPIKDQLVLPLVSACDGLSSRAQRLTVFMTFSILLSEVWNCVQKRLKKGLR